MDDDWLDVLVDMGKTRKNREAVHKMNRQRRKSRKFLPGLSSDRSDTFARIRDQGMRRPTMVMWGYNDPTALLEQGYKLYDLIASPERRAFMHVINRAGHFSMREQPEFFTAALTGFIQSIH